MQDIQRFTSAATNAHRASTVNASTVDAIPVSPENSVTSSMACFTLYSAARATSRAYRSLLAPWSLTYPQYLVLAVLWNDGEQTMRSLGAAVQLDSGTLTPLIRRLSEMGYVEKQRDTEDERVVRLFVTDSGWELRASLSHIPEAIRSLMSSSDLDLPALITSLRTLSDSLEQPNTSLPR